MKYRLAAFLSWRNRLSGKKVRRVYLEVQMELERKRGSLLMSPQSLCRISKTQRFAYICFFSFFGGGNPFFFFTFSA